VKENTNLFIGAAADAPPEMVRAVLSAPVLFMDTETTGLSAYRDRLALLQIHERQTNSTLLIQRGFNEDWLERLFSRKDCTFVFHNGAMFDLQFLASVYGVKIFDLQVFDTLIAESLLSTSGRRDVSVSLRASVRRRVGLELDKDIQHGQWASTVLTDDQVRYAVQDVLVLVELYDAQILKAAESKSEAALQLEMFVAPVLARMSWNGMPLPSDLFFAYTKKQQDMAEKAHAFLRAELGGINLNSPKQLIPALHRRGIDLDSTNHNTLVDYIAVVQDGYQKDIVQALLNYRAPNKRASMYSLDWYMDNVTNGVVHPLFWSIGADTLRMSSSKPNLQQVPRDARSMFGGVQGRSVVSVDYSQLEIRVAAALARDGALLDVLSHDDVHTAIASQIFGRPPESITPGERKAAKAASFTLLFGGSARTMHDYARRMGAEMSLDTATSVFRRFFAAFKGLNNAREKAYAACKERNSLVIKLPGGAKRVLFGEKLKPQVVLNTMVQGTAAIGMKHAIAEVHRRGLSEFLSLAVHDELVASVPSAFAQSYANELSAAMICGMGNVVDVEIKTEAKCGETWS
jgi:DNA polymerase-1